MDESKPMGRCRRYIAERISNKLRVIDRGNRLFKRSLNALVLER